MPNKKILFIAPSFFNYEHIIKEEMVKQGYSVDYYDERPSTNNILKGLIRINRNLVKEKIKTYFNKIMKETKDYKYDIVFIIKCETFSKDMLEQLRELHYNARFVLYLWDSIANYPQSLTILPVFDKVFSFDSADCKNYNNMEFLPLFYSKEYQSLGIQGSNDGEQLIYDVLFVGTAHTKRFQFLMSLKRYFDQKNIKYYYFMYLPSKLLYIYRRLLKNDYRQTRMNDFQYKSLNKAQVLSLFNQSKVIVDFQHHLQSGLTMRTLECLGAKKKMITSNRYIKQYDFYNPNNIFVINESLHEINLDFINSNYTDIADEIYNSYAISNWVKRILSENRTMVTKETNYANL